MQPGTEATSPARPRVSVLCVTHARRDYLLRCLESCTRQEYPNVEILVVLNPSDEEAERAIRKRFQTIRVLRTHRNLGFFPALNVAIANATGEYVMTVDDDAYFLASDALAKLVAAFEREPELGAVTCNLEGPTETPIAGGDRYIHVFTTGFTMLPRRVFTEWVGYYPDLFFIDAGETYVCAALWDRGKRVKRLEQVRMYHARTMEGRPHRAWKFHVLRSQILCSVMRDPWYLIVPSLASKLLKSVVQYFRWGGPVVWAHAWLSALLHLRAAWRLRQPISWQTQKLLWTLRDHYVTDLSAANGVTPQSRIVEPRVKRG